MVFDYGVVHLDEELSGVALVLLVELRLDLLPLLPCVLVVVGILKLVEKLDFSLGICDSRGLGLASSTFSLTHNKLGLNSIISWQDSIMTKQEILSSGCQLLRGSPIPVFIKITLTDPTT
jgi:hypothetical protein